MSRLSTNAIVTRSAATGVENYKHSRVDNPKETEALLERIIATDMMIFVMVWEEGTERGGERRWGEE